MTVKQFIQIWNSSLSIRQVRDRTGMNRNVANAYAQRLREKGHDLQRFKRDNDDLAPSSMEGYEPKSPAKKPTMFRPGTNDKVYVFMQRVERQEHLWHPDDAPHPIASLEKFQQTRPQ